MSDTIEIPVNLGPRSYKIIVGSGILSNLGDALKPLNPGREPVIITDPLVDSLYSKKVAGGLRKAGFAKVNKIIIPRGESHKSLGGFSKAMVELSRMEGKRDRSFFIINLGGGVIGDLGGFVAATYRRGIPYVQVPTTLLGFVDCGVGGKVAVNIKVGSRLLKNMAGCFYQPKMVFGDIGTLKTLDARELRSGLAEAIKCGIIESESLFRFIEENVDGIMKRAPDALMHLADECYRIKVRVVEEDELDTKKVRMMLNFGHTVGHAIEGSSGLRYRHGEAVALGMLCESEVACAMSLAPGEIVPRIENLLMSCGLPVRIEGTDIQSIMETMKHDKKWGSSGNRFVLPASIGSVKVVDNVDLSLVRSIVRRRFRR